MSVHKIH